MDTPLKRARLTDDRKPSQAKVAAAVDVEPSIYSRLESGELNAAADVAQRLADYFGVKVTDIFTPARYVSEPQPAEAA